MIATLTSQWTRILGVLGRVSMYRLVVACLAALTVVALVLSFFGLVVPDPLALVLTLAVLLVACVGSNALVQRLLRRPVRIESAVITAYILLFVLRPSADALELLWIALAGVIAMASKFLLAWRGRHIFNPAAVGASVLTISGLGASAWWVGSPVLAAPVILLGLAVLVRTERVRVVAVFLIVAIAVAFLRESVQTQQLGIAFDPGEAITFALWSTPFLFLGAFMLTEPLTLPPRRWQQFAVAGVVGVLAGWPIPVGDITLGQERALLIGNLLAFVWGAHRALRMRLHAAEMRTPSVRELTFRSRGPVRFTAGQYLELDVPHRRADARGTRREFSIVSAPSEAPTVRIAYRVRSDAQESSFKRALGAAELGGDLRATGVWGDFVLPRSGASPLLMVAAGIGITPFISQLKEMAAQDDDRDVALVYVASEAAELAFRHELEQSGVPVFVFTRDEPKDLPTHWRWARGVRLDAEGLRSLVPDLGSRHAYVSGPPALIADLAPALADARSLTTDAFAGY